jgi:hypothetical protein
VNPFPEIFDAVKQFRIPRFEIQRHYVAPVFNGYFDEMLAPFMFRYLSL